MQSFRYNKSTLFLTLFLVVVAFAIGTSAYSEPIASWPVNTVEPIDTGVVDQAKTGGLAVQTFFARGNADFKKDLTIEGVAQGGNPGDTTSTVQIASNVLVTGDIYAGDPSFRNPTGHLQANSLRHGETNPKTVCGDENGIVVFCADVCDNIDGEQPAVPVGYESLSEGQCTPVPDLCENIDGIQSGPLDPNHLSIEDPINNPKFCTQTIHGTIWAWQDGNIAINMARTANLTNLQIKNITIKSVGGRATTTWPSATPLAFRWSYCGEWNRTSYNSPYNRTDYTEGGNVGPSAFNGVNAFFGSIQGSFVNGVCTSVLPSYQNTLITSGGYGRQNRNTVGSSTDFGFNGKYTGWDGARFFDAYEYDTNGSRTRGASAYNLFGKKTFFDDDHLIINLPLKKLILNDVKVPAGYKLKLTTDTAFSPGTEVEVYPYDGRNTLKIAAVSAPAGYLGGPYVRDSLTVPFGASRDLPDGTYTVTMDCRGSGSNSPNVRVTLASFTFPTPGGVTINNPSCI